MSELCRPSKVFSAGEEATRQWCLWMALGLNDVSAPPVCKVVRSVPPCWVLMTAS